MNNHLKLALIFCLPFLTVCGQQQTLTTKNSNSNQIKNRTMDSINQQIEVNKNLVKLWLLEGWNKNRNKEVADQIFSQEWQDASQTFTNSPKGSDGAVFFSEQLRKALPDVQFTITHLVADVNFVTVRMEATATHKGTFLGIPATDKQVIFSGMAVHQIENRRIIKSWNIIDLFGLKMQLEKK